MNDLDKVYAESVAKEYMPKETNKVRQLKKLDERAKRPAFITALSLGLVGILIFGTGMCFGLGQFGNSGLFMAAGVLLGILGIIYGIKNGLANDFSLANWIPNFADIINPEDGGYFAAIVYNLLGFELIGSIGSQIEDPKHTVPKMTIIAGIAIVAIYCLGSFGVLAAIPADQIDSVDGFVYALKELCTVFGPLGNVVFYIVIFGAILTLVANMITWTLGGNEAFMAADLDKRSKFLGHRHPKYGTADNLYYVM